MDSASLMETASLSPGCLCERHKVLSSDQGECKCNSLKINRILTGHETVPLGLKHSKGYILSLIKHIAAVPAAMSSVSCCGKCVIKMQ